MTSSFELAFFLPFLCPKRCPEDIYQEDFRMSWENPVGNTKGTEVRQMAICKDCKSFFVFEDNSEKGDCVQRVVDPRQAYYTGRCGWPWCDRPTRRGVLIKGEVASIIVVVADEITNESN